MEGFHWQGGWYFKRLLDSSVKIAHSYMCENGEEVQDMQIEIDADS